MKQLSVIFNTRNHVSGLILRVTAALVILPHGCQLLLGWFGGMGYSAAMDYFTQTEGLPVMIGFLVILLQFAGSLLILLGILTRLVSTAMIFLFLGMIVTTHWQHGFFMNWTGTEAGEGFEFHLLVIGLCLSLVINGAGVYSFDAWLSKKWMQKDLSPHLANLPV
ncbi:MAG: DoxX family protein [Chitinophagales bacterium]|nr:DoxX family protein [Chitinophagales bacterium]